MSHPDQCWGGKTYAQSGEDLMVCNIFQLMGIERPSYLDVGAHHPWNISNTALLHKRGSRGVNVEANPVLIEDLLETRVGDLTLNVGIGPVPGTMPFYMIDERSGRNTFSKEQADSFCREHPEFCISEVRQIAVITLNQLVDQHCHGRFPDFLSLDVEGMDEAVLMSTSFEKSFPKVMCVEVPVGKDMRELRGKLADDGFAAYCRMWDNVIFVNNRGPRWTRV